jgi:hypothetical protein
MTFLIAILALFVYLSWLNLCPAHTSARRDSPFIGANGSHSIEDAVGIVLCLYLMQSLVVFPIEGSLPVRLAEIGLWGYQLVNVLRHRHSAMAYFVQIGS